MKYLLILALALFFNGCNNKTDEEKEEKAALEDKHISFGGDGTYSSPYKVGNGSYGSATKNDTYYDITLNGSCNVLLYELNYNSSFTLFDSNFESFDINATQIKTDGELFELYKDVPSGTNIIKSIVSNIDTSRIGIFGSCITNVYSYVLPTVVNNTGVSTSFNTFSENSKMYTFTLSLSSLVKINGVQNIGNIYIFDSNLNILYSQEEDSFSKTLNAGTYYFLINRGANTIESSFKFIK